MAREWVWRTVVGSLPGTTTTEVALVSQPCTVQRIVGDIMGATADTSAAVFANFFWIISVGATSTSAAYSGEDPANVMLHGLGIVPVDGISKARTTVPAIHFDSEGQRVIPAGQSLWCRMDRGLPAINWAWQVNIRVLLLLPEA